MTNKEENHFEYWIMQASNGRNAAECWQACYRILKETENNYKKIIEEMIGKEIKVGNLHYTENGLDYADGEEFWNSGRVSKRKEIIKIAEKLNLKK